MAEAGGCAKGNLMMLSFIIDGALAFVEVMTALTVVVRFWCQ